MRSYLRKKLLESLLTEKDNRTVLINKLGASEEVANWAHNLSDKLSLWIFNSLKAKHKQEMDGLENQISLDQYYEPLTSDYRDIINLLKKDNRPNIDINKLTFDEALDLLGKYRYIEAWLDNPASSAVAEFGGGFLKNKTWDEALQMADQWHQTLTAGGDVADLTDDKDELIHTFGDGFQWFLRRSNFCSKSKDSMGHCATASRNDMYLLRLIKGNSEFITADWDEKTKTIIQLKGLNNKKPIAKYHPYITWLIRDWGGVQYLKTDTGYLPQTNFQLGELEPNISAEIFGNNPNIMNFNSFFSYTPNENKSKLIANLFKYNSFVKKLIPNGFPDFLKMAENKDMVIASILNNPNFLYEMNRYEGYLTDTLERLINVTKYKDKLIEALINRDGFIEMLDGDGEELLINNHSNPDMIRDAIFQFEDSDMMPESVGFNTKILIKKLLREFLYKN